MTNPCLLPGLGTIVVVGAAAIVVAWRNWWSELGNWFVDIPGALPVTVIPAALCAILVITAWMMVRRAPIR